MIKMKERKEERKKEWKNEIKKEWKNEINKRQNIKKIER